MLDALKKYFPHALLIAIIISLITLVYKNTCKAIDGKASVESMVAVKAKVDKKVDEKHMEALLLLLKERDDNQKDDIREQKEISKETLRQLKQLNKQMIIIEHEIKRD